MSTSAVEVSIQETSPLFGVGAGAAAAAGAGAASAFFSSALASAFAGSALASAAAFSGALSLSCAPAPPAIANSPSMDRTAMSFFIVFPLESSGVCFAGADAHNLLELEHEDLAVADLAGVRGLLDRLDHAVQHLGLDRGFDLHFRQEVHHVLRAAIQLGVALLPAEALDLGDGDALHADARERFAHLVELE